MSDGLTSTDMAHRIPSRDPVFADFKISSLRQDDSTKRQAA